MKSVPFCGLVKRGMAGKGLTLRELCRKVSLDPSFFSKVLSGKRSPPAAEKVLRRIAYALDLSGAEVVVAAGRIPVEWNKICEDRDLFERIQNVLTAHPSPFPSPFPSPLRGRGEGEGATGGAEPLQKVSLAEELL